MRGSNSLFLALKYLSLSLSSWRNELDEEVTDRSQREVD